MKWLRNFKPADEADADFFFGEYGYSFNHPVHQSVGILRKVEIFCGDEFHDFLGFVFSAHILLGIQFRTFFHLSQLEHLIADLLDSQIYDFTPLKSIHDSAGCIEMSRRSPLPRRNMRSCCTYSKTPTMS